MSCCLAALLVACLGVGAAPASNRPSVKIVVAPKSPVEDGQFSVKLSGYSGGFKHLYLTTQGTRCKKRRPSGLGFGVATNSHFKRTIQISNAGVAGTQYACAWLTVKNGFARNHGKALFKQKKFTVKQ